MASAWVYLMSLLRGPSMLDAKRKARLQADRTIQTIQEHEAELQNELRALALTARQAQKQAASQNLRATLAKSKATRQQLTMLVKKRQALQNHLDTLKNSELNEQVLSSVKQTSTVLKNMGLEQSLSDMDAIAADMQEAQSDLHLLQEGLSDGFSVQTDEDDLESELELLLSDTDAAMPILSVKPQAIPVPSNSMHSSTTTHNKVQNKSSRIKNKNSSLTPIAEGENNISENTAEHAEEHAEEHTEEHAEAEHCNASTNTATST